MAVASFRGSSRKTGDHGQRSPWPSAADVAVARWAMATMSLGATKAVTGLLRVDSRAAADRARCVTDTGPERSPRSHPPDGDQAGRGQPSEMRWEVRVVAP